MIIFGSSFHKTGTALINLIMDKKISQSALQRWWSTL